MRYTPLLISTVAFGALGASCGSGSRGDDADPSVKDATTLDATPLWDGSRALYEASVPASVPRVPVVAEMVTRRVDVQGMMFSAGEMQISGEPFAEFFGGRNLAYYDRAFLPPDRYLIPLSGDSGVFDSLLGSNVNPIIDVFGFSTAVESYEYSKYHMNSIVEFSGAGVSLVNGPLVLRMPQAAPQDKLIARVGELLTTAGTNVGPGGTAVGGYATLPPPPNNTQNLLGFPGLIPTFAPYSSFDPTVAGSFQEVGVCGGSIGYSGVPSLNAETPLYECSYNSLHLPDAQLDHVLIPAVLGFATWKQSLWAIDFAGRLHDSGSNPVNAIKPSDEPFVGTLGNRVVGTDPPGAAVGTYVGSIPLEGMWGLNMVAGMDNLDEWLLSALMTSDGATLGGFASKMTATAYDYTSPLFWFPAAIHVAVDATQPFPPVTALTLADSTSRSIDLGALLLGNAMFFAITDARNAGVGQRIGLHVLFDGNHAFPADDGKPDGEETAHDRALAVLRVAFVDLDRLHADPSLGIMNDSVTIKSGRVTRSGTVSMTSLGHVLIGLRQTVLSLDAAVTQYGAADESSSADARGILNCPPPPFPCSIPIHPPGGGTPAFSAYVRQVFVTNATFVRDVLTTEDGHVANGATISNGKATVTPGATLLESQTAAARALTEAFLLTGDATFEARARTVMQHLHSAFYSAAARMFRGQEGGSDEVSMTPERFGWLQSALRETDKTLYVPGDPTLGRPALEDAIARVDKLFMNGWDDLNGNQQVDHGDGGPDECLGARLQQAEQSLTGELGRNAYGLPVPDRDGDCVLELAHAQGADGGSLSVFAGEVHFHSP
jgi:hypothetical protein